MFFILSKTFYILVMPLTLVIICLVASFIIKRRKYKKRLFLMGIMLLLFFSNSFIVNEIFLIWETPPTPISSIKQKYKVGIVLSGISNMEKKPQDRVYFNKGADRITHAFQLYKQGIIDKILISGGSGSLFETDITESEALKEFLLLAGVELTDILIENASRNTYENAQFSAELLNKRYPSEEFLLITSAFHMKRAQACFKKINVNVATFSTDFYSHDRNFHFDTLLFPNIYAFEKWTVLIRELTGLVIYKITGYI